MSITLEKPQTIADLSIEQKQSALKHFRKYPLEYVDKILLPMLNIRLEEEQREVLSAIFEYKNVLIYTHHAFGKSLLCAIVALTISNLYNQACVGTTIAPTFRQVQDVLWKEMRAIHEKVNANEQILLGKMNLTRYDINTKCFVVGISPRRGAKGSATPEFIQGTHESVVFVIGDEAGGLDRQIFEQVEGISNTAGDVYKIYIGNPLNINSEFGQMCHTEKGEGYIIIGKPAYASPNMVANGLTSLDAIRTESARLRGLDRKERMEFYKNKHYKIVNKHLLSPGWVMQCFMKWGESPLFFSKAIGEWSQSIDDTLVPLARVNEIMLGTYIDADTKNKIWESEEKGYCHYNGISDISIALDCSGDGADKNSLCVLEGNRQVLSKNFSKTWELNSVDYRGTTLKENGPYIAQWIYNNVFKLYNGRLITFAIDCTGGFGNTVFDALMDKTKYPLDGKFITIRKITFGATAQDDELYHDNIAEMAFTLADDINRTHDTAGQRGQNQDS